MEHVSLPLPGTAGHPEELLRRLAAALAARGPGYRPRTRHLRPDGSAQYANRLLLEASPYLRQHAHNPVDWYPWGPEAFAAARRLGRPILLSIGYSTCHWCHVMEEESFEDEEIAAVLNARYVAIKLDREERPDVDAIYMKAVQLLTGQGGWPMTTWLTADGRPFFGGTYFPARDGERGARVGFLTLLDALARVAREDPERVAEQARQIAAHLGPEPARPASAPPPTERCLAAALDAWSAAFDARHGGVGHAPKFPSALPLRLLLREWRRTGDGRALAMAERTLRAMARGGIHDQIGGGFHRYSVDAGWLVPHFEKMLYDNALLVLAYLEGYAATRDREFARVAERTLAYLDRELSAPEGGFHSATDADSLAPDGRLEEGRFFTWTPAELRAALEPAAARLVAEHLGVTDEGQLEGRSVLHVAAPLDPAAEHAFEEARERLYRARSSRPAPALDDKILTSWNALTISAFARAALVLGQTAHAERAEKAAGFVLERMSVGGRLRRAYAGGAARLNAYLDDYACLVAALLDLYEATSRVRWLSAAVALQAVLDERYWDPAAGGYFLTSDDHERLLVRDKPDHDGAEPAGNSVAALNLRRLHALTLDERYRERAARLVGAFGGVLLDRPAALGEMLLALSFEFAGPREIVIVAPGSRAAASDLLDAVRRSYAAASVLVVAVEGADLEEQARYVPALRGKVAQDGRPTAYVCRAGACELPVLEPAALEARLSGRGGAERD